MILQIHRQKMIAMMKTMNTIMEIPMETLAIIPTETLMNTPMDKITILKVLMGIRNHREEMSEAIPTMEEIKRVRSLNPPKWFDEVIS